MTPDLAHRRALLFAALSFALLRTRDGAAPPATEALRKWLDTWRGVGDVVTGMEHALTNDTGTACEPTAWRAVQVAAWEALNKTPGETIEPMPAEYVILP